MICTIYVCKSKMCSLLYCMFMLLDFLQNYYIYVRSSSAGKTSEEDKDEDDSETEEAIKKAREWDAFRDGNQLL